MTLLVTWLWQGIAVAVLTTLLIRVVPRHAAARRHLVWWFALVLLVAIPVAELLSWLVGLSTPEAGRPPFANPPFEPDSARAALLLESPPATVIAMAAALWAVTVAAGGLRLVLGWAAIQRIASTATPLGAREHNLSIWNRVRATGRRPALRVSPRVRGACAVGLRRPTIVLSSDLAAGLNDEQLEHVVLHEFAHLQRYDDWSTLAERVVLTVAWFHPAVHWIARQIDLEMEAACDECVIAQTGDATEYGRSLLDVAALGARSSSLRPLVAPGSSAHAPILRTRIERLAAGRVRPRRLVAGLASAACVTLLASAVVTAATLPALVVFESTVVAAVPAVASPRLVASLEPARMVRAEIVNVEPAAPAITESARRNSETVAEERAARDADAGTTVGPVVRAAGTPAAIVEAGAEIAAPEQAPEPLAARAIAPGWQSPRSAAVGPAPNAPGSNVAQRSAAGITRAALSTAGAFTRFGQAVAGRF